MCSMGMPLREWILLGGQPRLTASARPFGCVGQAPARSWSRAIYPCRPLFLFAVGVDGEAGHVTLMERQANPAGTSLRVGALTLIWRAKNQAGSIPREGGSPSQDISLWSSEGANLRPRVRPLAFSPTSGVVATWLTRFFGASHLARS